jgi:hypothetical protein
MRLGMAAVRQVAMGFSMVDQHRHGQCEGFDYDRFWSHSLLMAVAMQALAARSRAGSPEEMFTCGLMARIGCLALATVYPAEYAELLRQSPSERDLAALERQHLRADHHEFTAAILEDCGVPHALIEPVIHHEDPDTSGFTEGSRPHRLAHLFHHGKRIADMGLAPESERSGLISELMLLGGKLGLDANEQGSLIDGIVASGNGANCSGPARPAIVRRYGGGAGAERMPSCKPCIRRCGCCWWRTSRRRAC